MFTPNQDMIASSLKFNKAGVLDCYLQQKEFAELFLSQPNFHIMSPGQYDPVERSPPLQTLREIGLRSMKSRMNRSWKGRVLYGTFCVDPLKLTVLQTVFEDRNGDAVAVSVTNFGNADPAAQKFRKGQRVALKQPRLQQNNDGRYSLRVNNPEDVEIVSSFPAPQEAVSSDTGSSDMGSSSAKSRRRRGGKKPSESGQLDNGTASREKAGGGAPADGSQDEADALRIEGNSCLKQGQMEKAIELYTQAIASLESRPGAEVSSKLLLCYSNRAEAWLRLDEFEKVVEDADRALELDSEHEKSLFRKGKALHGLQEYEECKTCMRKLLDLDTPDVNVQRKEIEHLIAMADNYSMGYMQVMNIDLSKLFGKRK